MITQRGKFLLSRLVTLPSHVLSGLLHSANLLSNILPQTRSFELRSRVYRLSGVKVGSNVRINGGVVFQHSNVVVGDNTWIGRRTEFAPSASAPIILGSNCDISQDVLFVCGSHAIGGSGQRAGVGYTSPISIGEGSWVGARCLFLGGSSVGGGCIVAAGSVVRDRFPDNVMIGGVPARLLKHLGDSASIISGSDES